MTAAHPHILPAPAAVRALNWLTSPVRGSLAPLTEDSLLRYAEKKTGLSNWGSDDFLKFLRAAIPGAKDTDKLTTAGLLGARKLLRWKLMNRLMVEDLVARHPEIREIPIERPIFIVGWWRTGTTYLHNLMSLEPTVRSPRTWELYYPAPTSDDMNKDVIARRKQTKGLLRLNKYLIPDQDSAHFIDVDTPEECFLLMENNLSLMTLFFSFGAHDYAEWMLDQDLTSSYEYLKLQYQILQWRYPERRWVFKCPYHMWYMDTLLKVFPDACIVHTHRDITKALPSVCSLSAITGTKLQRDLNLDETGAFFRKFLRRGVNRSQAVRRHLDPARIIDVPLREVTRDPVDALRRIYDHFGFHFNDSFATQIRRFKMQNPKHKHGAHRYSLEEFGLDEASVRAEFSDVAHYWEGPIRSLVGPKIHRIAASA